MGNRHQRNRKHETVRDMHMNFAKRTVSPNCNSTYQETAQNYSKMLSVDRAARPQSQSRNLTKLGCEKVLDSPVPSSVVCKSANQSAPLQWLPLPKFRLCHRMSYVLLPLARPVLNVFWFVSVCLCLCFYRCAGVRAYLSLRPSASSVACLQLLHGVLIVAFSFCDDHMLLGFAEGRPGRSLYLLVGDCVHILDDQPLYLPLLTSFAHWAGNQPCRHGSKSKKSGVKIVTK